jgi:transcriptional regulator with XRE-family HTH domain
MNDTDSFGERLKQIRKLRGYSQGTLAKKINVTPRVISYYERESKYPPAKLLSDLSSALEISIEELLGSEPVRQDARTVDAKFWPKWQELKEDEKKTVSRLVDTLLAAHTH